MCLSVCFSCISAPDAHPWLVLTFPSDVMLGAIDVSTEGSHKTKNYTLEFRSMETLATSVDSINTQGCLLFSYNYLEDKELFRTEECPQARHIVAQVVSAPTESPTFGFTNMDFYLAQEETQEE